MVAGKSGSAERPRGGYAAGCARLAARHWLSFMTWCDLDKGRRRFRVNVRMGSRGGPFPHWVQVFDVGTPIDQAVEEVAAMAWRYFTTTGYAPPPLGSPYSGADLEWASAGHVADFDSDDEDRRERFLAINKRRLPIEQPPADRRR